MATVLGKAGVPGSWSRPAPAAAVLLFSEGRDHRGWLDPAFSFKVRVGWGGGGGCRDAEASFRRSRLTAQPLSTYHSLDYNTGH